MSERLHCPWPGLLAALVLVASGCGGGHDLAIGRSSSPQVGSISRRLPWNPRQATDRPAAQPPTRRPGALQDPAGFLTPERPVRRG
jgi:hypothetical protein